MKNHRVYLDTSALIKRYTQEVNSDLVSRLFEDKTVLLFASVWAINESIAAFDRKVAKRQVSLQDRDRAISALLKEATQHTGDNRFAQLPISEDLLLQSTHLIIKHHISADDALHLATALSASVDCLVAGDKRLVEAARVEGLESYNLEIDSDAALLRQKLEDA